MRIRQAWGCLAQAFSKKFPQESVVLAMSRAIVQRTLPGPLLDPIGYGIFYEDEFEWNTNAKGAIKFFLDLMNWVCTGVEKVESPYDSLINEWLNGRHQYLLESTAIWIDPANIKELNDIILASVPPNTDFERRDAENALLHFLNGSKKTQQTLEMELLRSGQYSCLLALHNETNWTKIAGGKDVEAFTRESEDSVALKLVVEMRCPLKTAFDAIHAMHWHRMSPNTKLLETIERVDDEYSQWYTVSKRPFPFNDRDYVFCKWDHYDPKTSICLEYCTVRSDRPEVKGIVRGDFFSSGFILESLPRETVRLTYYLQEDNMERMPNWAETVRFKGVKATMQKFKEAVEVTVPPAKSVPS